MSHLTLHLCLKLQCNSASSSSQFRLWTPSLAHLVILAIQLPALICLQDQQRSVTQLHRSLIKLLVWFKGGALCTSCDSFVSDPSKQVIAALVGLVECLLLQEWCCRNAGLLGDRVLAGAGQAEECGAQYDADPCLNNQSLQRDQHNLFAAAEQELLILRRVDPQQCQVFHL